MWSFVHRSHPNHEAQYTGTLFCEYHLVENRGQLETFQLNATWTLAAFTEPTMYRYVKPHSSERPVCLGLCSLSWPHSCLVNSSSSFSLSLALFLREAVPESCTDHILPAMLHDVLFHPSTCHNFNSIICLTALMSVCPARFSASWKQRHVSVL